MPYNGKDLTTSMFHKSFLGIWNERELIERLVKREIKKRYRGSIGGVAWLIMQPICMMSIYTFVFSTVFKSRWPGMENIGTIGYAINMFAGLIVFNFFAECTAASPSLITGNRNYVTKVVFPLEILSVTCVLAASAQAGVSTAVLGVALMATGVVKWTILIVPLVWIPILLMCMGLSWLLAAIGAYLKDVEQLTPVFLSTMMFLIAVFFPIEDLPEIARMLVMLNPLALAIETVRSLTVAGEMPSVSGMVMATIISAGFAELSLKFFRKAKRGFSDVL